MDSNNSSEPKNEGFDRQVGFIEVAWSVLAGAFILLICAYSIKFSKNGWSSDPDAWGQFGDFLGGVLNPLVSLAALFALVISVRMQRTELKDTRAELIEARKVAIEQAKTADQQRREQRFFDLLNLYQRTVDSLSYQSEKENYHGKSAIAIWLNKSGLNLNLLEFSFPNEDYFYTLAQQKENAIEAWIGDETSIFLDHYFRVIYRILKDAENLLGEDDSRYIKLFRAQLNQHELMLLTYNMWLNPEGAAMRPYATKYGLLKHLFKGKLKDEVLQLFESAIFGKSKEMQ